MSGDCASSPAPALAAGGSLGLYPASDFRLTDGRCADCPTIRQGLWYFAHEMIAVPNAGMPVAGFATGITVIDDLRAWLATRAPRTPPEFPGLVWVAAAHVVAGAWIGDDGTTLQSTSGALRFSLIPKIPLNRSYFDRSSGDFFRGRSVKVRGNVADGAIVARTLWPEDFRLDRSPPRRSLHPDLGGADALRALIRADPAGGARSPYAAWTIWQRDPAREAVPPGRAALGIMVNGAQGDDDEAHAGHFALVTGRTQADGAIGDWLVNNFYSLDTESEKGILAAPVPLDNYLADLNSGQGWYRPSHLLVAVLATDEAPALVQAALNRVYNQFWRHQLVYRHASMNCGSISIDVLRTLGLDVPARGPTSRLAAAFGFPWFAARERSIAKARIAFDYLVEDQTRLMPAAAFEVAGARLLALAAQSGGARDDRGEAGDGALANLLVRDLESIVFVRFPQFPSSRAFGDAPAITPREFHARVPAEPGMAQIVPVPPRPFPDELRDADLLPAKRPPSDYAAILWGLLLVVGLPLHLYGRWKRSRQRPARK